MFDLLYLFHINLRMEVQIINKSKHPTPNYETEGAAGIDQKEKHTEKYQNIYRLLSKMFGCKTLQ